MDEEAAEQDSRHVNLFADVDAESVSEVVEAIHQLSHEDKEAPIHLHLCTQGGSMQAAVALVDIIEAQYTAPVHTFAWGDVCSAGVFILAAGTQRWVGRTASVMLHGLSGSLGAPSTRAMQASVRAFERQERALWQWLDRATGHPEAYWQDHVSWEEELWMTAAEAVEHGLADAVVPAQ